MALTTQERSNIIKLTVAMFNAAPGASNLADMATHFDANGHSLSGLAVALANTATYKALNPTTQTASEFAAAFLTPLGLQANTEALDFITTKFNAGVNKGQIAYEAALALHNSTSATFAAAKAILDNKSTVAEYYSVTKAIAQTSIGTLQSVISTVTSDTASVTSANAAIDSTGGGGGTFALAVNAPVITEIMVGGAITKAMTFTLTLGTTPTEALTVNYATQTSGSAAAGADFAAATGSVTFVAGQTVANVSVLVNADDAAEADETVAVLFSGAGLVSSVTGTGTILANDTTGLTVVLTAGTDLPVLGPNDDTINSSQAVPVQLGADDLVAGGLGTDTLTITPTVDTAFTLADAIFTKVSGIEKMVIANTGTGGQTIIAGGLFQAAFGTAGVDLQTTATTAATGAGMVVDLSAVTGPVTLTTTTTTGAQTITTGSGNATVFATASTGAVGITTGAGWDVVTLTSSDDTTGVGCVINTGAGNDTITIIAAGTVASTNPNLITAGLGADTITLSNDGEWNNIVIGNTDSGITLAGADRINGFVAATDNLKMGTAAGATGAPTTDNYVEAVAAVADYAAALGAANIQLASLGTATTGALEAYAFQWDATNGYLFNDTDGNGSADQVVVMVGVTGTMISNVDIIA